MAAGNSATNLLEKLARGGAGSDPWASVAAKAPSHAPRREAAGEQLDSMLERINALAGGKVANGNAAPEAPIETPADAASQAEEFLPIEPKSFREARLTDSEVSSLSLKYLLARGEATGRDVADQVKLPFLLVERLLSEMKQERLIVHKGAAAMNDYVY
jgi:hypothetical protein